MATDSTRRSTGTIAALWGVLGVVLILLWPIVRLAPHTADAFASGLTGRQWFALFGFAAFMLYSEGYRGFQKSFSPRVVQRAAALRRDPTPLRSILAPLFCIGYFGSPARLKRSVYGLTFGIIVLVVLVQRLEQPWRGIVDCGVLLGLSYGIIATLSHGRALLRSEKDGVRPANRA